MSTGSPSDAPYALVKIDIVSSYVTPRTLSWHNITVSNEAQPTKNATETTKGERIEPAHKFLLDDVSGEALPGELLAVVGSSRSVTSTLITVIASRTPRAAMTGVVRVNQQPVHAMGADVMGFVPRDAPLSPLLTVHDHLALHAHLRLGSELSNEDRSARVTEVLAETGLTDATRTLIGDGTGSSDSLSARDRTLLLLATELLTRPSIILLDEPTLGLDAFDANALVYRLQALSRAGYTVVISATFDQPTSAMFTLFDKLLLLADDSYGEQVCGRTVFHGKPLDALAFVQSAGLPCPPLTNPFEFFLHQLSSAHDPESSTRVHTLVSAWSPSKPDHGGAAAPMTMVDTPLLDADGQLVEPQGNSIATQLSVLLRRNLLRMAHDASAIHKRIITMVVIAVFFGIIFLRLDMSQLHVQSFGSAAFFMTAVLFSTNASAEYERTSLEAAIALRDHSQKFYHVLSWYTMWNLTELPFQLLFTTVLLVPAYFLVGFPADATVFFEFYLFACLIASTGVAVGYCASCAAPRKSLVSTIGTVMVALSTVFGGPFMNRKTTPVYFLWAQQMSPVKYSYHGMLRAFWSHIDSIPCPAGAVCRVATGQAVLALNVVRPDKFASDWQILLAINLTLRVLGGLGLWLRASRK